MGTFQTVQQSRGSSAQYVSSVLMASKSTTRRFCNIYNRPACLACLQLPYHELEKLNGIEEVKQYLHKKLLDVPL